MEAMENPAKFPRATPAGTAVPPGAPHPPRRAAPCAPWRVRWAPDLRGPRPGLVLGENVMVSLGKMVL